MNLAEFRQAVADHPDHQLQLLLDDGTAIAPHFHVTEVGRVEKHFVDCGGKRREAVACVLQTLVAGDVDHRLSTTKLARILDLVDTLQLPGDAPVEVEHQERSVSIDAVAGFDVVDGVLQFRLTPKHTACLAEDACGISIPQSQSLEVVGNECCGGSGCC